MGPRCLPGPAVEDEISRSRADLAVGRRTTSGGVSPSAAATASLMCRVRSAVSRSAGSRGRGGLGGPVLLVAELR